MGRCYAKAGDFQRAAEAYEVAAHLSDTEEERADHVVAGAGYFFKAGNKDNAYSWLMSQLGVITSLDAASKLYEGLAALYHLDDNAEFRAIALEKALERRPNDTSLHFDAAYSYSEGKLEKLALLHYKIAIN